MDPARKRTIRLVVALSAALLLAVALVYTSFSASSEARSPSQLLSTAEAGKSYQLTGKVVPGYERNGTVTNFRVRDRTGSVSVPVCDSSSKGCKAPTVSQRSHSVGREARSRSLRAQSSRYTSPTPRM